MNSGSGTAAAGYEDGVMTTPQLDEQLCFALYAASRATTNAYRPGLARLGLTYPQFVTLLVLWRNDGLGVATLAQRLHLDASTLSPLLKRMEAMGLVERRRSAQDERRVTIHLTAAGTELAGPATEVHHEVADQSAITPDEADQLRTLARRLLDTLEPSNPGSSSADTPAHPIKETP